MQGFEAFHDNQTSIKIEMDGAQSTFALCAKEKSFEDFI